MALEPRQALDDRRNQIRGESPARASAENHLQLAPADLLGQTLHQVGDVPVAGPREADVTVVTLVSVEAEVPEEEVRLEVG